MSAPFKLIATRNNYNYNNKLNTIDSYRETLMKSGQDFTNALQSAGAQASDINSIQKEIDNMTSNISKLSDMSNGFDLDRFTRAYLDNVNSMANIFRSSMRFNLVPSMMGAYIDMGNSMMGANTKFMETVTDGCVPSSRSFKLRQQTV